MFDHPMFRAVWSSLLPQNCLICGEFFLGVGACSICFSLLRRRLPPLCNACGCTLSSKLKTSTCLDCKLKTPIIDDIEAPFSYEPIAGQLLKYAKRCSQPVILERLLSELDTRKFDKFSSNITRIVMIPDRVGRYMQRGFSPSGMITKTLSKTVDAPVDRFALSWRKQTPRQTGLTRAQRSRNLVNAFKSKCMSGERLLLVDDVYTTGYTMNEAAKTLRRAGAAHVHGFALCYKDYR